MSKVLKLAPNVERRSFNNVRKWYPAIDNFVPRDIIRTKTEILTPLVVKMPLKKDTLVHTPAICYKYIFLFAKPSPVTNAPVPVPELRLSGIAMRVQHLSADIYYVDFTDDNGMNAMMADLGSSAHNMYISDTISDTYIDLARYDTPFVKHTRKALGFGYYVYDISDQGRAPRYENV